MDILAGRIDHTMLSMNMQRADVLRLCEEAMAYEFAAVCVPSYFTRDMADALAGSNVKACTVIGFPFGYYPHLVKKHETETALRLGAKEIDLVINQAAWFSGDRKYVLDEISAITALTRSQQARIKVIIETGYLNAQNLADLCNVCAEVGVDYVKTSTGFGKEGANVEVVREMRRILPENIAIKASGGIRDRAFALELLAAGADRIGTSSGTKMILP
ncbi:MAG: deoxyribose-phosphate aldolase [Sphingobacteriaceae bacterium]|nr:deoxyribose-phosphate aldolase [Sphingobacteriaceae bacterium]